VVGKTRFRTEALAIYEEKLKRDPRDRSNALMAEMPGCKRRVAKVTRPR
jgi:hypothetical protein